MVKIWILFDREQFTLKSLKQVQWASKASKLARSNGVCYDELIMKQYLMYFKMKSCVAFQVSFFNAIYNHCDIQNWPLCVLELTFSCQLHCLNKFYSYSASECFMRVIYNSVTVNILLFFSQHRPTQLKCRNK